jgi:hypothetical protein
MSFGAFLTYFDRVDVAHIAADTNGCQQRRIAGKLTDRYAKVEFRVESSEASFYITVSQKRRDPNSMYAWNLTIINGAGDEVGQTNHGSEFCRECHLSSNELNLKKGSYFAFIKGHSSRDNRRLLPLDFVCTLTILPAVKSNGSAGIFGKVNPLPSVTTAPIVQFPGIEFNSIV